jgi:hypothetical protein
MKLERGFQTLLRLLSIAMIVLWTGYVCAASASDDAFDESWDDEPNYCVVSSGMIANARAALSGTTVGAFMRRTDALACHPVDVRDRCTVPKIKQVDARTAEAVSRRHSALGATVESQVIRKASDVTLSTLGRSQ